MSDREMTPERVRELLDVSTLGPWYVDDDGTRAIWGHEGCCLVAYSVEQVEDANLIAAAPELAQAYLEAHAEIERLRATETVLRAKLADAESVRRSMISMIRENPSVVPLMRWIAEDELAKERTK